MANLLSVIKAKLSIIKVKLGVKKLKGANLSRAKLVEANLSGADLSGAKLYYAALVEANLSGANLSGAKLFDAELVGAKLVEANLSGANLSGTILSFATLTGANLSGTILSFATLTGVDLSETNLSGAKLIGANLYGANLSRANLSGARLDRSQALNINLQEATLTGACIQDWNINSETNLKNIKCDYIFLKLSWNREERKNIFSERRPHQKDKKFEPGDFEKLVRKSQETIDLIFRNGIDWQAFTNSYEQLKVEGGGDFFPVKSIEKSGDSSFVVKLNSPLGTDKDATEKFFEEKYQAELKLIEARYKQELKLKDVEIDIYKQQNTDFIEIIKIQASRSINVEPTLKNNNSESFHNNQQGANIANNANIVKDNARQQAKQYNSAPEQKQSLAEAATEIQQLLDQLSQTYSPEEAEQKVAEDLANKAKQDSSFKEKLKNWSSSLANKGTETAVVESIKEGVKRVIPLAAAMLI